MTLHTVYRKRRTRAQPVPDIHSLISSDISNLLGIGYLRAWMFCRWRDVEQGNFAKQYSVKDLSGSGGRVFGVCDSCNEEMAALGAKQL